MWSVLTEFSWVEMKGHIFLVTAFVVVFSAASDALAIGFEVDTPLDPFLGGLSKIKRNIIRRMKDLSTDDGFVNDGYGDQLNLFFSQPPVGLPPLVYPDASNINFQLPLSQRRLNQIQIPQQLSSQFSTFNNAVDMNRREAFNPSFFGLRHLPELVQQLTQILPVPLNGQFSDMRQRRQ